MTLSHPAPEGFSLLHRPLVLVEWLDHTEDGPHWKDMDSIDTNIAHCFSVGWVLAEDDQVLTISPHLSVDPEGDEPDGFSSAIKIAKGALLRRIPVEFRRVKNS